MLKNILDSMKYALFVLMMIGSVIPHTVHAEEIIIHGKVPIYIHPDESPEVHRAVTDLLRDLHTVFGQTSPVVKDLPKTGTAIVVATGNRFKSDQPEIRGWEAHQLYANHGRIVLNGADNRGTIYAIYTFSELLGVKPLWLWASEQPKRIESLKLAANFEKVFDSPDIKYRAWLPNDTDFLTPWQNRSEENYEALFESMLRLKLNTIEGGIADEQSFTTSYKPGRQASIAKQRGIITTGHHMQIFGSNYSNWEQYWQGIRHQPVPELSIVNRKALSEWWTYHIDLAMRNNLEVIWLVGFRGNRDIPFWEFFPDAPADAQGRANIISEMVQLQIDLLKQKTKNPNPLMRLTLYNEMTTLVADQLLHIPDEPSLIRNFVAARRDHFPAKDIFNHSFSDKEPTGYYMNFQFTSTGSHLAQAEGPRKMEQNYRIVDSLSRGQLVFSVVNAGNIREHVLELAANAEMMWNFETFSAESFLNEFSNVYYGPRFGPEIASLYQDFFNSYWQQKKGDIPGFERQYLFQDMRYGRAAEMLLNDLEVGKYRLDPLEGHPLDNPDKGSVGYFRVIPADNNTDNQLEAILKGTMGSIAKLELITSKADQIYPQLQTGQRFFDDNLRGQAYLMLHLNQMLNFLARAYQDTADHQQRLQFIRQSLAELQLAQQRLRQSEHGRFTDWYASDSKFSIKAIRQRLENLEAKLRR